MINLFNTQKYGYNIVQIEVNNTCNMACTFCPLPIRNAPNRTMDRDAVFKIIEDLSHYEGIDFVAFHQFGEPLLNKDIWDFINHCHNLGLRCQLVTNALLLKKLNIDRIIKHQPDILRISAQILDPDKHEEVRGVKMDGKLYLDQIAQTIASLIDMKDSNMDEIRIDLAINGEKQRGLKIIKKHLYQVLGIAEYGDPTIYNPSVDTIRPHVIELMRSIENKSKNFKFSIEKFDKFSDKYYSIYDDGFAVAYDFGKNIKLTYKLFFNGRKLSQYYPINKATCATNIIGILSDGNVTLCCIDYEGGTTIGNIFEDNLDSILNRSSDIIHGLHYTGDLHFDICKRCLGCPTKRGVFFKNKILKFKQLFASQHSHHSMP